MDSHQADLFTPTVTIPVAHSHEANLTDDLEGAEMPSSEAWFVPDPEDSPPEEPSALHILSPQDEQASEYTSSSTLPSTRALGIRLPDIPPPAVPSSLWGSGSSPNSQPPLSPEGGSTPTDTWPHSPNRLPGPAWSTAVPLEIAISPRGRFSPDVNLTSPRVSAHRVQGSESPSGKLSSFGPSTTPPQSSSVASGSSTGSQGKPSISSASPIVVSPRPDSGHPTPPPPQFGRAMARDSYDTADGSSSHVSGSLASRATVISSGSEIDSPPPSAQLPPGVSGSVPTPSSMVSPRSSTSTETPGSLRMSSGSRSPASTIVSPRGTQSTATMRPPRTKSVALNPMAQRVNSGGSSSGSPNSPSTTLRASPLASISEQPAQTESTTSPSPRSEPPPIPSTAPPMSPRSPANSLKTSIGNRRTSSNAHGLSSIAAPIVAALNLAPAEQEMQTGGDIHLHQWAFDTRHKHPFIKVSADHSSLSWSSTTNYGLVRGTVPLSHTKSFIEVAKTRGVSQLLQIGLAKASVNWSASPEKMQFNSLKIQGEWTAVWVKTSTTGDRFGVLYDLESHKLTIYRNGLVAYTQDIPHSFQVVEDKEDPSSTPSDDGSEASSPSPDPTATQTPSASGPKAATSNSTSPCDPVFPFIGVCGDQDILITESPEFEKYVDIVWAHDRVAQLLPHGESLEGVPAVLDMLGLQKLRPKFEGMDMATFQKLKDADLRKLGATTEQRRRLLSQFETMKP